MANVLLAFFSGLKDKNAQPAIPCFYEGFINGMLENGNQVLVIHHNKFNTDFGPLADIRLEKTIRTFNPDVAFIFNNSFYDLAEKYDFPIIIYDVDSPRYYSNKQLLKNNPHRYKFITSQSSSITTISAEYGINKGDILRIPFFTPIKNEPVDKVHNICFIGTRFSYHDQYGVTPWNRFMASNPGKEARRLYREMIEAVKKYPAQEKKIIRAYAGRGLNEHFLGLDDDLGMRLSGAMREQALSQVSDLGLVIYGSQEWVLDSTVDVDLALAYDPTPVASIMDNQNVYNSSKIGININHVQADSGFSWRVLDIMASGACLVTEQNKRLNELFPDINIPVFNNRFEAREVCRKLLTDDYMRYEIVSQCNEAIESGYRFKHILPRMEEFTGIKMISKEKSQIAGDMRPYILCMS